MRSYRVIISCIDVECIYICFALLHTRQIDIEGFKASYVCCKSGWFENDSCRSRVRYFLSRSQGPMNTNPISHNWQHLGLGKPVPVAVRQRRWRRTARSVWIHDDQRPHKLVRYCRLLWHWYCNNLREFHVSIHSANLSCTCRFAQWKEWEPSGTIWSRIRGIQKEKRSLFLYKACAFPLANRFDWQLLSSSPIMVCKFSRNSNLEGLFGMLITRWMFQESQLCCKPSKGQSKDWAVQ